MRNDKNGKLIREKNFTDAFGTVNLTNEEEKEKHFGEICRGTKKFSRKNVAKRKG